MQPVMYLACRILGNIDLASALIYNIVGVVHKCIYDSCNIITYEYWILSTTRIDTWDILRVVGAYMKD